MGRYRIRKIVATLWKNDQIKAHIKSRRVFSLQTTGSVVNCMWCNRIDSVWQSANKNGRRRKLPTNNFPPSRVWITAPVVSAKVIYSLHHAAYELLATSHSTQGTQTLQRLSVEGLANWGQVTSFSAPPYFSFYCCSFVIFHLDHVKHLMLMLQTGSDMR